MTKMCRNLYSVIIVLLMTTSVNSSNEPVCDFITKEGKLRALGLYRRFDQNGSPSYWLFARDTNETVDTDIEYKITNSVSVRYGMSVQKGYPLLEPITSFLFV